MLDVSYLYYQERGLIIKYGSSTFAEIRSLKLFIKIESSITVLYLHADRKI